MTFRWRRNMKKRHRCMHTGAQTRLRCCSVITVIIGTRRRCGAPSLNISDTSPDYFFSPSLLKGQGRALVQPAKSMRETWDTRSSRSVSHLSFTQTLQLTWEMRMPVSFSTAAGSLVMISSTSPVSLAAPTSEPPLDTIVIFWAAHSGLLISSAICRMRENRGINAVKRGGQWKFRKTTFEEIIINPT